MKNNHDFKCKQFHYSQVINTMKRARDLISLDFVNMIC
jgi:hypothetical protein